jgi:hypothetical protein
MTMITSVRSRKLPSFLITFFAPKPQELNGRIIILLNQNPKKERK